MKERPSSLDGMMAGGDRETRVLDGISEK